MESFSCKSSSFRFAVVLSFFASSARLTESVSLRSLACSLCSISCRFFAFQIDINIISEDRVNLTRTHCITRIALLILDLSLVQSSDQDSEHAFSAFALPSSRSGGEIEARSFPRLARALCWLDWRFRTVVDFDPRFTLRYSAVLVSSDGRLVENGAYSSEDMVWLMRVRGGGASEGVGVFRGAGKRWPLPVAAAHSTTMPPKSTARPPSQPSAPPKQPIWEQYKKTPRKRYDEEEYSRRYFAKLCAQIEGGHFSQAVRSCDSSVFLHSSS
jgi:hypothetical protein